MTDENRYNIEDSSVKDLPDDWWKLSSTTRILAKLFDRHMVALFVRGIYEGERHQGVYSGFPTIYQDNLLWVTSGHVLKELEDLLNNTDFILSEMRWLDGFRIPAAASVPVYDNSLDMYGEYNDEIDFGVIRISGLQQELLLNNDKIIFITEQIWKNLGDAKPEGYYIIGYPTEWTNLDNKRHSKTQTKFTFLASLACLPVKKIEYTDLPNAVKRIWKDREEFYGEIIDYEEGNHFQPESIKGMSGGPVLSIERDSNDQLRYRLFGIQSKWEKKNRIICAEPMEKLIPMYFTPPQQ